MQPLQPLLVSALWKWKPHSVDGGAESRFTTLCLKTLLGSFHSLSACTLNSCSSDLQHCTKSELKVELQKSHHQHTLQHHSHCTRTALCLYHTWSVTWDSGSFLLLTPSLIQLHVHLMFICLSNGKVFFCWWSRVRQCGDWSRLYSACRWREERWWWGWWWVGVRKTNTEGQTTMNFVKMTEKTVENMYFKKREEQGDAHRWTTSISEGKIWKRSGENVAGQHWMLVCRITA